MVNTKPIIELCQAIEELRKGGAQVSEQLGEVAISGSCLSVDKAKAIRKIEQIIAGITGDNYPLVIQCRDDHHSSAQEVIEILEDGDPYLSGANWELSFQKKPIAATLAKKNHEGSYFFTSKQAFISWAKAIPKFQEMASNVNFFQPCHIFVNGIDSWVRSELLLVTPISGSSGLGEQKSVFPSSSEIASLTHINSPSGLTINPKWFALTEGDTKADYAEPLITNGITVLAVCLSQEIHKEAEGEVSVILRGIRYGSYKLGEPTGTKEEKLKLFDTLTRAVSWVYEEKKETRIKLIADRLSIDADGNAPFIETLSAHLASSLIQARDSYSFVISERKDAYHKELRDIMKDMKAQSDLYAMKTREMVSASIKDMLALVAFIGLSFVGKFDIEKLGKLVHSKEFSVFCAFFACYLVLSFLFQARVAWLDVSLSYKDNLNWINATRNHLSKEQVNQNFVLPIEKRKEVFICWALVVGIVYLVMFACVFNITMVIDFFIN